MRSPKRAVQARTLKKAKATLAVPSFKRDKKWFWGALTSDGGGADD